MEFIVVICKRSADAADDPTTNLMREVIIDDDDESSGLTDNLLRVDAGPHEVHLGEPLNYGPPTMHIMLPSGSTSQFTPRRLLFWLALP